MPRKPANEGLFRKRDKKGVPQGFWYLPIHANGTKYVRSTGTENLEEAKVLIPHIVSKLMKELEPDSTRTSRIQWRLSDLLEHAIRHHSTTGAPNTVKGYKNLEKWLLAYFGNVHIELLTQDTIRKYAEFRLKTPRKPTVNSVAGELTKLVSALRLAGEAGAFQGEPKSIVPKEFRFKRLFRKRFLTPIEVQALLSALEAHNYSHIIPHVKCYLYLGLRKEELFGLKVSQVDLHNRSILVPGTKTRSSYATLPLPDVLIPILSKEMEGKSPEEPVFKWIGIWHMLNSVCKKAKLPHVSIHDFRRTTGSLLVSAGANLKVVQQILRHQSMEVTSRHYAHLVPNVLPQAINALEGILDPKLPVPSFEVAAEE